MVRHARFLAVAVFAVVAIGVGVAFTERFFRVRSRYESNRQNS
jgi:hypothetical protein